MLCLLINNYYKRLLNKSDILQIYWKEVKASSLRFLRQRWRIRYFMDQRWRIRCFNHCNRQNAHMVKAILEQTSVLEELDDRRHRLVSFKKCRFVSVFHMEDWDTEQWEMDFWESGGLAFKEGLSIITLDIKSRKCKTT